MKKYETLKCYITPFVTAAWEQGGKGKFSSHAVIIGNEKGEITKPLAVKEKTNVYNDC